ncbi:hypothetical protein CsatB_003990 [Cannabis sativa]
MDNQPFSQVFIYAKFNSGFEENNPSPSPLMKVELKVIQMYYSDTDHSDTFISYNSTHRFQHQIDHLFQETSPSINTLITSMFSGELIPFPLVNMYWSNPNLPNMSQLKMAVSFDTMVTMVSLPLTLISILLHIHRSRHRRDVSITLTVDNRIMIPNNGLLDLRIAHAWEQVLNRRPVTASLPGQVDPEVHQPPSSSTSNNDQLLDHDHEKEEEEHGDDNDDQVLNHVDQKEDEHDDEDEDYFDQELSTLYVVL